MKTNKSISKKITTTILIVCFSALLITGIIIVKTVSTRFKDNKRQILNETALSISNKAEVFFPNETNSIVLTRLAEGKPWVFEDWQLVPWKGYVLKKAGKIIYTGQ